MEENAIILFLHKFSVFCKSFLGEVLDLHMTFSGNSNMNSDQRITGEFVKEIVCCN